MATKTIPDHPAGRLKLSRVTARQEDRVYCPELSGRQVVEDKNPVVSPRQ